METLPAEIIHEICLNIGFKQTLNLCKTSKILNEKISADCMLWKKFSHILTKNPDKSVGGYTKDTFLSIQCFKLYLEIDILQGDHHNCAR